MAKRIVKTSTGGYAEIDDVPWWQDKSVILSIITTAGMIVAAWNAYWAKDEAKTASAQSADNRRVIGDVKKEVQHTGRMMGRPPVTAEEKE